MLAYCYYHVFSKKNTYTLHTHEKIQKLQSLKYWDTRLIAFYTRRQEIYRLHLERIVKHFLNLLTKNIDFQVIN